MKRCMKFCPICVFPGARACIDLVIELAQLQQIAVILKAGWRDPITEIAESAARQEYKA